MLRDLTTRWRPARDPEIRPVARERPIKEGSDPLVDVFAQLGNGGLRDAGQPHRLHQLVHPPGRDPADPGCGAAGGRYDTSMSYRAMPRLSAWERNSSALSRCRRAGRPDAGHGRPTPLLRRYSSFGSTAWLNARATLNAEVGSRLRWKPATMRVATSMARVSQGRCRGCQSEAAITITSANVWSICTSPSGCSSDRRPTIRPSLRRARLAPLRRRRISRRSRAPRRRVTALRDGGCKLRSSQRRPISRTRSASVGQRRSR